MAGNTDLANKLAERTQGVQAYCLGIVMIKA